MKICKLLAALIRDETGGEVVEYAVVAGLVTVVAIGVIGHFGTKVVARWTAVNTSV